ncbi:MAG: ABC transporter ATP-binding protein [Coriobacteriales bacterium]|jgi:peptide/nickel transport system ATP-binding protein
MADQKRTQTADADAAPTREAGEGEGRVAPGAASSHELLRIRGLKTTFHSHHSLVKAVRGVDLTVYDGDFLAVVGESGSGKSVTMKSVMGIMPDNADVEADELTFDGRDMLAMSDEQRRCMRGPDMAMIFQDPMTSLDPVKTIGNHLREVLKRHRGITGKRADEEAIRVLGQVGIPSPEQRLKQYPHEFSGGMRQRVLIAMALCCQPRLLIADEPTTALDVTIQAQILELLQRLGKEMGMSVVLITHDLGVVASLCNRVAVMYGGLIMETGTVRDIFYRPCHPYTRALLGAVPNPNESRTGRLESIPGSAPSLIDPPDGCPFAERCSFTSPACTRGIPDFIDYATGQRARCVFSSDELDAKQEGRK